MKESITIKNFGGIKDATIPLNSINIFIGKQASGKSVTAKLVYFFKRLYEDILDYLLEEKTSKEIEEDIKDKFKKYFPSRNWPKGKFSIKYEADNDFWTFDDELIPSLIKTDISIEREARKDIKINCKNLIFIVQQTVDLVLENSDKEPEKSNVYTDMASKAVLTMMQLYRTQIFVPASRAFFSNLQYSIFSILASGSSIDPFLLEFGSNYERFKHFDDVFKVGTVKKRILDSLSELLNANFVSDKTGDYLVHQDGRKIDLLFCSSGQQELLPLALILRNRLLILNSNKWGRDTLYIEEPEAHLFPSSQKKLVEVISSVYNFAENDSQLIITTHSPYILTSFNNLLQAGYLLEQGVSKRKLFKIVPKYEVLKCGELNAFAFADGQVTSLIDEETGLISADMLDEVSEEIAIQFDKLLEL